MHRQCFQISSSSSAALLSSLVGHDGVTAVGELRALCREVANGVAPVACLRGGGRGALGVGRALGRQVSVLGAGVALDGLSLAVASVVVRSAALVASLTLTAAGAWCRAGCGAVAVGLLLAWSRAGSCDVAGLSAVVALCATSLSRVRAVALYDVSALSSVSTGLIRLT